MPDVYSWLSKTNLCYSNAKFRNRLYIYVCKLILTRLALMVCLILISEQSLLGVHSKALAVNFK